MAIPVMLQEDGIKKISLLEFAGADIRVGRILDVRDDEGARKPMNVLSVGFCAQIGSGRSLQA